MTAQRKPPIAKPGSDAHYEALSNWAETDMEISPDRATALHGAAAAAHGRDLIARALGGRPSLDPLALPGEHSRARRVRLPRQLDERAAHMVESGRARDFSSLMRAALAEYVDRHQHDQVTS